PPEYTQDPPSYLPCGTTIHLPSQVHIALQTSAGSFYRILETQGSPLEPVAGLPD
ncbi:hypothetical protein A2U01_0108416, partial [Trifolium medium]|nr:hypothetical protein [Trifolium medium]